MNTFDVDKLRRTVQKNSIQIACQQKKRRNSKIQVFSGTVILAFIATLVWVSYHQENEREEIHRKEIEQFPMEYERVRTENTMNQTLPVQEQMNTLENKRQQAGDQDISAGISQQENVSPTADETGMKQDDLTNKTAAARRTENEGTFFEPDAADEKVEKQFHQPKPHKPAQEIREEAFFGTVKRYQVQLSSFSLETAALKEKTRMVKSYADELNGLPLKIKKVELDDGQVAFRILTGNLETQEAADVLCLELTIMGGLEGPCLVMERFLP